MTPVTSVEGRGNYVDGSSLLPNHVLRTLTQAAVDTKAASGNSDALDTHHLGRVAWVVNFQGFTGGTSPDITFTWQHSPDGTNWFDIAAESALSAAGVKSRVVAEHTMRYVRVSWATTGSPTTATTDFWIQAR